MTIFGYLEMERICIRNLLQENDFPLIIMTRECDLMGGMSVASMLKHIHSSLLRFTLIYHLMSLGAQYSISMSQLICIF